MPHYPVSKRARRWEEAGLVVGILLVVLNWFALVAPQLSGPVFHPVWILLGLILIYACALTLAGATSDSTERYY